MSAASFELGFTAYLLMRCLQLFVRSPALSNFGGYL